MIPDHLPMHDPVSPPVRIYGTLKGHRRFFSPEDDQILRSLRSSDPTITWAEISQRMPGFTTRQIRERWFHYVSPLLNTATWTPEEDAQLLSLHAELGSRWATIGARMNNRSPSDVKNRFQSVRHRRDRMRRANRRAAEAQEKEAKSQSQPKNHQVSLREEHPAEKHAEFSIISMLI
jgi:hypothetical protein